MSSNNESLEQKFKDWGKSPNGFIVQLRTTYTFDEKALESGLQLLKEYLEVNKDCISYTVLQIVVHMNAQLNNALHRSMSTNDLVRTEAILKASYQIQDLVLSIRNDTK